MLARRILAANDPLLLHNAGPFTGGSGTNHHVFTPINLGPEHPQRAAFILVGTRTNSTTGSRAINAVAIDVGAGLVYGTLLANSGPGAVANPTAVYRVPIPYGTVGNLQVFISGNATGVVSMIGQIILARGGFEVESAAVTGNPIAFNGTAGGVIIHQATNLSGGAVSNPGYTGGLVHHIALTGLTSIAGLFQPINAGTITVTTPGANYCLGVRLGQR